MAAWCAAFALALAGCTTAREPAARESGEQLAALCAEIQNSYECAQAIEAHQLQKPEYARRVARKDAELRLQLGDGKTVTVADVQPADEVSVVKHSFRDYLGEIGYFMLHRQYYEGEEYVLLHDRTGKMFPLPSPPVISPDRSRLVTTFPGLSGGYSPNIVQIWRVTPDGLIEEFTIHPRDWEPVGASWIDSGTIRLQTRLLVGDEEKTLTLKLRDGKWISE